MSDMTISHDDYLVLCKLYEKHKENPESVFIFKGRKVLTSYAKYLIEYLEGHYGKAKATGT